MFWMHLLVTVMVPLVEGDIEGRGVAGDALGVFEGGGGGSDGYDGGMAI